jgi:D-glucuronyl C5-epimerase C-terminus
MKLPRALRSGFVLSMLSAAALSIPAVAHGLSANHRSARTLLILQSDGRTYTRRERFLPADLPPAGVSPARATVSAHRRDRASDAATHGPSVSSALQTLKSSGAITASLYSQYAANYAAAQRTLKKLSGTRHTELADVIANIQAIAAKGLFTPSRLPALFVTLERNRQWWTTGPLLSFSQRVSFPGSRIVWEYYPGQGIEIQWLATFGEANGYYLAGNENLDLQELLAEVIPLATARAGGIAWEYLFQFDGGQPPWTSGLSQGTALQVLSRAWSRFKEPADLEAAKASLGIFKTPPPQGVAVKTAAGTEYAEYTYAPSDRILNGFIQSLVGLYDYTQLTGDPLGRQLFEAGDAEARAEVPHYNTGAWSMYDQYTESNLNYHELLTEFLVHLCQRTQVGPPTPTTPPTTSAPTTTSTPTTTTSTPPVGSSGGSPPSASTSARTSSLRASAAKTSPNAIIPDQIYCTTGEEFTEDLHTPPTLTLLSHSLKTGSRAGVQFSLSKVSNLKLTIKRGGSVVWSNGASVEGGKPKILWVTPKKSGLYTISARAVDLAGNSASTTGTITLSAKG